MTATTAGIPTIYQGTEYRSRLEARWGAFFRRVGWDAIYEPFDSNGYIPDFVIQGDRPLLIEIKPALLATEYAAAVPKVTAGVAGIWNHDILVLGMTPVPPIKSSFGDSHPSAGWLGEIFPDDVSVDWTFAPAMWLLCLNCQSFAVCHDWMSYASRPCGCYDGDHYMGSMGRLALEQHWGEAANDVKWRGRDAK
jgi:hypothetical protein